MSARERVPTSFDFGTDEERGSGVRAVEDDVRESADELEEWVAGKGRKNKKRPATIPPKAWEKALAEAREMMAGGDWALATPRHYVAVYAIQHEVVYGVAPVELTPTARLRAAGMAANMLVRQLGGSQAAMAAFLRWTWQREAERERYRRDRGGGGGRLTAHAQFNGVVLTDYLLEQNRRRAR